MLDINLALWEDLRFRDGFRISRTVCICIYLYLYFFLFTWNNLKCYATGNVTHRYLELLLLFSHILLCFMDAVLRVIPMQPADSTA